MRTSKLPAVLAVVLAGVACSDNLTAPVTSWNATISVAQEVPASTGTSTLGGTATVSISGATLSYTLTLTGTPTSTITAAHIHAQTSTGAATTGGVGAGVVRVNLCGAGTAPACPAGAGSVTSTVTYASSSALVLGSPSLTLDGLATILRAYGAYINVHTTNNAGGEARGQLLVPAVAP
jgi:hypothetical protein